MYFRFDERKREREREKEREGEREREIEQRQKKREKHVQCEHIYIWLVVSTPLKTMKISWDNFPNIWKHQIHVPKHQPVVGCQSIGIPIKIAQ